MLFNSYVFVFCFFPICLLLYHLTRGIYRKVILILLSLWFYCFTNVWNLPVLIGSMIICFGISKMLQKNSGQKTEDGKETQRKVWLTLGVSANIGALFLFKYTGISFVPLGISFFTFTQISYLVEVFRGSISETSFLDYCLYVSFFPKLLEGPIALPAEFLSQVEENCKRKILGEELYRGLVLFILGMAKKVLLADVLGKAADYGYTNLGTLTALDGIIVMMSYTLQLYFDFSGYCDMAMGIAMSLGYQLPLNFDSPYKAENIIEFWKGWHITLTRFFTKYLYIPLGGNRKGKLRTYLNILIIFFVSGIWHGKGVQFIIWGMMHGVLYAITRWVMEHRKEDRDDNTGTECRKHAGARLVQICKHVGKVALTFLYVNVAWIFFRAPSVGEAMILIRRICSMEQPSKISWNLASCFNTDEFWYGIKLFHIDRWQYAHFILTVLYLLATLCMVFFGKKAVSIAAECKPGRVAMVVLSCIFVWCVISFSGVSSFIYLNF